MCEVNSWIYRIFCNVFIKFYFLSPLLLTFIFLQIFIQASMLIALLFNVSKFVQRLRQYDHLHCRQAGSQSFAQSEDVAASQECKTPQRNCQRLALLNTVAVDSACQMHCTGFLALWRLSSVHFCRNCDVCILVEIETRCLLDVDTHRSAFSNTVIVFIICENMQEKKWTFR